MSGSFLPLLKKFVYISSFVLMTPFLLGSDKSFFATYTEEEGISLHLRAAHEQISSPILLEENYTINFEHIPVVELIKFASKVSNLNFIFNKEELPFSVTIVSKEPILSRNIISILIQILRINGLVVIEEGDNLLISKARNVNQLGTIISSETAALSKTSPIVTQVFRVKNAKLATVSSIIKQILSDSSLMELSPETNQLIVTDLSTNVERISALLEEIDSPHTPLEIKSYLSHNVSPIDLIYLVQQILSPFTEGVSLTLVPQINSNTIFVISTPSLVEQALSLFKELDVSTKENPPLVAQNQIPFLYRPITRSAKEFAILIQRFASELSSLGGSQKLVACLSEAKVIQEGNAILLLADEGTLSKGKDFLLELDTGHSSSSSLLDGDRSHDASPSLLDDKNNVYLYRILHTTIKEIISHVELLRKHLKEASHPDFELISALQTIFPLEEFNVLLFIGTENSSKKIIDFLSTFDIAGKSSQSSQFLIYQPKQLSPKLVISSISEIGAELKESSLSDEGFLSAIASAKEIPSTGAVLFVGADETLVRIKILLESIDKEEVEQQRREKESFAFYNVKHMSGAFLYNQLQKTASHLNDKQLVQAIVAIEYIKESNAFLIKASQNTINQLLTLIEQFDIPRSKKSSFSIYTPIYKSPSDLIDMLNKLASDLESSGLENGELLSGIYTTRPAEKGLSLVFSGTEETVNEIQSLLQKMDRPALEEGSTREEETFVLYSVQHLPGGELISHLKTVMQDLQKKGMIDPAISRSIEHLKWIPASNSILIPGSPKTIKEVENLIAHLDRISSTEEVLPFTPDTSFTIYSPKYQSGENLIRSLAEFSDHLRSAGVSNRPLLESIAKLRWMDASHSLIITGDEPSISKIMELLSRFDLPEENPLSDPVSVLSSQQISFLKHKLQYHQGEDIINVIKQVGASLPTSGTEHVDLARAISSLQWAQVTNSLLSFGTADALSKLKSLIISLDTPPTQILIELLVIETSLNNTQNFGLQWGGKAKYLDKLAGGTGNFPIPHANSIGLSPPSIQDAISNVTASTFPNPNGKYGIPFASGFDLGIIGDIIMHKGRSFFSLGTLLNALQADTSSSVLMKPQIIAQDKTTSTFFAGKNVPYIGSQVTSNSQLFTSSSNIEYRDIGFNFTFTPLITEEGLIILELKLDISSVTSSPIIGVSNASDAQSTITGIETSHTSMNTRIHVQDGHFVLLSGMINDTKARFKTGIPCLGGLPVVGALFSENDRVATKQNLIMFVRPQIIRNYGEHQKITDNQEEKFKEWAALPTLKEEIDLGIDRVKTVEDEPDVIR